MCLKVNSRSLTNKAKKTVVRANSSFIFFLLLFGDRAQITDVRLENDPLEYVELVGDSRTSLKLIAVFQTAVSDLKKKTLKWEMSAVIYYCNFEIPGRKLAADEIVENVPTLPPFPISIYTLSDLCDLSNLIGSLSRTIQH